VRASGEFSEYLDSLVYHSNKISQKQINFVFESIMKTKETGGKVFTAGNGGSHAIAEHFTTDISSGVNRNQGYVKSICLGSNNSSNLASGNDDGFENIFTNSLKMHGFDENDLVYTISSSGKSHNVLKLLKFCKQKKIKTVALTGFENEKHSKVSDLSLNLRIVNNNYTIAEDIHMFLCHYLATEVKNYLK